MPDLAVLLATGYSAELVGDQSRQFKVVSKPYDGRLWPGLSPGCWNTQPAGLTELG